MSEKPVDNRQVDSDDDSDDDDYCPTKQTEQSDPSDESEHDDVDDEQSNTTNGQDENNQSDLNIKPYDESKTNELWKNFASSATPTLSTKTDTPKTTVELPKPTKTFDYAGEKVSVPIANTSTRESPSLKRPSPAVSVLDRLGLGKKQKLSTLEKSRLDWHAHKESESLTDELDSHRRGKNSYVEKKAFLERSELREHDHYLSVVKKK